LCDELLLHPFVLSGEFLIHGLRMTDVCSVSSFSIWGSVSVCDCSFLGVGVDLGMEGGLERLVLSV